MGPVSAWCRLPMLSWALLISLILQIIPAQIIHDYIILGAGPAGLQMGYFLERNSRDYLILERANISGSFFRVYPRHGKLISINKRHTGCTNPEFNLRHDWNSLLSDDAGLLFRQFSREFFPDKADMVRYLAAFTSRYGLRVQYDTEVIDVQKVTDEAGREMFRLQDHGGQVYLCRTFLSASGMWKANIPNMSGMELAEGYESISMDTSSYEGQNVLILGHGNSAFETAYAIYGNANLVHILGRSRVRLSWETHYVGDVRGVNNELLDTYQLKSLDGVLEGDMSQLELARDGDKLYARLRNVSGPQPDNYPLRASYDRIVRCLGFLHDTSIYNSSLPVSLGPPPATKFPDLGADYQSRSVRDLYVIGAASHGVDYRRSAGGFIHGFRYTARAVHRLLEYTNHGVPWPHVTRPVSELLSFIVNRINQASGLYQMYGVLCDVIVFSRSGSEFTYLEEIPVGLVPELPTRTGHQLNTPHVIITLEYGKNFSGPGKDVFAESRATGFAHRAHKSNFLHPVMYYYKRLITAEECHKKPRDWILPRPSRLHHVLEDFLTDWSRDLSHVLHLRRFLEFCSGHSLLKQFSEGCLLSYLAHGTQTQGCQRYIHDITLIESPLKLVTLSNQ